MHFIYLVAVPSLNITIHVNVAVLSTWHEFFTAAPSAPPQLLQQTAVTATSITLNWQLPPEENLNGVVRFYYVFVTELESGSSYRENSNTTNYLVENLHPFYTYTLSVAAVTVAVGPTSDSIIVQTSETSELKA